jgi:hypothetical protein
MECGRFTPGGQILLRDIYCERVRMMGAVESNQDGERATYGLLINSSMLVTR